MYPGEEEILRNNNILYTFYLFYCPCATLWVCLCDVDKAKFRPQFMEDFSSKLTYVIIKYKVKNLILLGSLIWELSNKGLKVFVYIFCINMYTHTQSYILNIRQEKNHEQAFFTFEVGVPRCTIIFYVRPSLPQTGAQFLQ